MNKKINKDTTTFDEFMSDPVQKQKFDKDYSNFLLKEFLHEAMNENHISVRKLAEQSGISTSIIQNIRSEKATNVTFYTLSSLMSTLGYKINFQKIGKDRKKNEKKYSKTK
ncbi:MAG TPA: helix-turn-helix transcriptional regulator [Spirochaetota bacterium]|nr:helix-turn-helix transcriptional regulator [Spirochaetota bacterium]